VRTKRLILVLCVLGLLTPRITNADSNKSAVSDSDLQSTINESLPERDAKSQKPIVDSKMVEDYLNLGMASLKAEQYEKAREQLMVALALNSTSTATLYQLTVAEFNLGKVAEARARLRQAYALIKGGNASPQQERESVVELTVEGEYNFIPVSRDGWQLQPKDNPAGGRANLVQSLQSEENLEASLKRIYRLDAGSIYQMKLEPPESIYGSKESKDLKLLFIPIGLFVVWSFAR